MSRNIRVHCLNLSAFAAVCIFFSATVQAQTRSLTGNQGGNNQTTSNLNSAGQSTLSLGGDSLQSQSGQGLGSFTQQAGGGTPGGQQQGGFIGRGNNANRFIGRGTQGGQTQLQRNNFSQFGGNRNTGAGNNRTGNRTGTGGTQRVIRPRLRIAFAYMKPSVSVAVTTLSTRFEKLSSRRPALSGVRIETGTEGEVTLQGTVKSAETRKLAEIMARMQPGVRKVRNELSVSADASQP
jgi:hypothetical protein